MKNYWIKKSTTDRKVLELPTLLKDLGDANSLSKLLADIDFFYKIYTDRSKYDFFRFVDYVADSGNKLNYAKIYTDKLFDKKSSLSKTKYKKMANRLADYLKEVHSRESVRVYQELIGEYSGDAKGVANYQFELAEAYADLAKYDLVLHSFYLTLGM